MGVLSERDRKDIVEAYTKEYIPMIKLAEKYGISRQAIYKMLKKADVNTDRSVASIPVSCCFCGKEFVVNRAKVRNTQHLYCDRQCYYASLRADNHFQASRTGARAARKLVLQYINLPDGAIVHHIDKNQKNNRLDNLLVFAGAADHLRHHRGFDIEPLWSGGVLVMLYLYFKV